MYKQMTETVGGLANVPGNPPVAGNNHDSGQDPASAGGGDGEGGGPAGEEQMGQTGVVS